MWSDWLIVCDCGFSLSALWWQLRWHMSTAERSYPTSKVRGSGQEELPHIQGEEQRLHFAGAAMKRYPTSKVRGNPSKTVGVERGHQKADRLNQWPESWEFLWASQLAWEGSSHWHLYTKTYSVFHVLLRAMIKIFLITRHFIHNYHVFLIWFHNGVNGIN